MGRNAEDPRARVVILDDDLDLLESMTDLIADFSGRPSLALRSFAEMKTRRADVLDCDLALLDVNLGPGVPSGLDAYHWLKREGFTGRIVFLTGHAHSHPLVAKARDISGACVLLKPIEAETLLTLIEGEDGRERR